MLDEQSTFEFQISGSGNPCSDDYLLEVPFYDTLQYQWYRDGVALPGETRPGLRVKSGEGQYAVRLIGPSGCRVTRPYLHRIPQLYEAITRRICPGETFRFGGSDLTDAGTYIDTLKSVANCDSIVQLTLQISDEYADTLKARIFQGEQYRVGPYKFGRQGRHTAALQSGLGCDSLVYIDLDFYQVYFPNAFSPNGDGFNDHFTVFGREDLEGIVSLQVFDRWGGLLFSGKDLPPNDESSGWDGKFNGRPAPAGVYVYSVVLRMDDGVERRRSGAVLLVR